MLKVGQKVMRTPALLTQAGEGNKEVHRPMTGKVVYVHPEGRYHMVAFETRGGIVRECFDGADD